MRASLLVVRLGAEGLMSSLCHQSLCTRLGSNAFHRPTVIFAFGTI